MKVFHITTFLSLVVFTVSRAPILTQPSSIPSNRDLAMAGCTDPTGYDQHIEFHSSTKMFEMDIPMTGANYNLGTPDAQLQCSELTSATQSDCQPCWDRMLHVEITKPGHCSFALTDDIGQLFSVQIDHTEGLVPFPEPGYLALVTCYEPQVKTTRSAEDMGLSCEGPNDTALKLDTGSQEYILLLPANETVFDIIGPKSTLGCFGPIQQEDMMCQACNFPVQSIEVGPEAGNCALNFSGYASLIYSNSKDGILKLPSPTQLWSVMCGLDDAASIKHEPLVGFTEYNVAMRSSDSRCLVYEYGVTFNTTNATHPFNPLKPPFHQTYMSVPGNKQWYLLTDQAPELYCFAYSEPLHPPCHVCYDDEIVSLYVDEQLGECHFYTRESSIMLIWRVGQPNPIYFNPPIRLAAVSCGFGLDDTSLPIFAITTSDVEVNTQIRKSSMLARYAASSTDFLCSDSGYNISVFTSDGNVYCPPVPVDFEFHPMSDMKCLRPADHVLVNCTEIGAAIAVNSVGAWGPCIFFTKDHRSFFTDFITSPIVQAQIVPGNAVSGISCGSGLTG